MAAKTPYRAASASHSAPICLACTGAPMSTAAAEEALTPRQRLSGVTAASSTEHQQLRDHQLSLLVQTSPMAFRRHSCVQHRVSAAARPSALAAGTDLADGIQETQLRPAQSISSCAIISSRCWYRPRRWHSGDTAASSTEYQQLRDHQLSLLVQTSPMAFRRHSCVQHRVSAAARPSALAAGTDLADGIQETQLRPAQSISSCATISFRHGSGPRR